MNFANILTKTIGAGALVLSVQDAHIIGKAKKNKAPQQYIAKTYPDMYINTQRLNIEALPSFVSKMKQRWFNTCLDDTIVPAMHATTGYISGFSNALVNNVAPIALGVGALALKRGGKVCAALLGLMGLKMFLYDICGIGQYKKI